MALTPRLHDGFLPGRHLIEGFGQGGFRFGGITHRGSILVLPSGIHACDLAEPFHYDEAHYTKVFAEAANIDLLVIGTGLMALPMPQTLRWQFRDHRISADAMTTASACSTLTMLLGEGRRVAALLLAVA